jgi:hypothetical protein
MNLTMTSIFLLQFITSKKFLISNGSCSLWKLINEFQSILTAIKSRHLHTLWEAKIPCNEFSQRNIIHKFNSKHAYIWRYFFFAWKVINLNFGQISLEYLSRIAQVIIFLYKNIYLKLYIFNKNNYKNIYILLAKYYKNISNLESYFILSFMEMAAELTLLQVIPWYLNLERK